MSDFENKVVYDGWVLSVEYFGVVCSMHTYDLRVGCGDQDWIKVRAFRQEKSERLKLGALVRVTGRLMRDFRTVVVNSRQNKLLVLVVNADQVKILAEAPEPGKKQEKKDEQLDDSGESGAGDDAGVRGGEAGGEGESSPDGGHPERTGEGDVVPESGGENGGEATGESASLPDGEQPVSEVGL